MELFAATDCTGCALRLPRLALHGVITDHTVGARRARRTGGHGHCLRRGRNPMCAHVVMPPVGAAIKSLKSVNCPSALCPTMRGDVHDVYSVCNEKGVCKTIEGCVDCVMVNTCSAVPKPLDSPRAARVTSQSFRALARAGTTTPKIFDDPVAPETCHPSREVAPLQRRAASTGTSLTEYLSRWEECTTQPWVLSTVARGYRLQFAMEPPISDEVIFSQAGGQAGDILQAEILSLLHKGAIQEVLPGQNLRGFYSCYFLVKKKGGGVRPILDLRALNRYST